MEYEERQLEPISVSQDARGMVFEPVDGAALAAQRNVHVVLSRPGAVRGNHYHREATEVLVVVGPALVRLRRGDEVLDYEVPDGEVQRCTVPPGVTHAIRHHGDRPGVLISFATRGFDPAKPDTYRDVLIDPTQA